jgi:hypothetical protein
MAEGPNVRRAQTLKASRARMGSQVVSKPTHSDSYPIVVSSASINAQRFVARSTDKG